MLVATLAMAAVLEWLKAPLEQWIAWSQWSSVWELTKLLVIGVATYILTMFTVGIRIHHFKTVTEG